MYTDKLKTKFAYEEGYKIIRIRIDSCNDFSNQLLNEIKDTIINGNEPIYILNDNEGTLTRIMNDIIYNNNNVD